MAETQPHIQEAQGIQKKGNYQKNLYLHVSHSNYRKSKTKTKY